MIFTQKREVPKTSNQSKLDLASKPIFNNKNTINVTFNDIKYI